MSPHTRASTPQPAPATRSPSTTAFVPHPLLPSPTPPRPSPHKRLRPPSCSTRTPQPTRRALLLNLAAAAAVPFATTRGPCAAAEAVADSAAPPLTGEERQRALEDLERVTELQTLAFEYTDQGEFERAEKIWTRLIGLNEGNAASWSNRGNCRTSQGRFEDAVQDFNKAIELASAEPDPYLGRGVAYEGMRRFEDAIRDDVTANEKSMSRYGVEDPVAWNNRGNAQAGLGRWEDAKNSYHKAALINPQYVFARANEAMALYQLGDVVASIRTMKFLARKYPIFADMEGALTAVYWAAGDISAAETAWAKALAVDKRYEDMDWVENVRRWPPKLVKHLTEFQSLKAPPGS